MRYSNEDVEENEIKNHLGVTNEDVNEMEENKNEDENSKAEDIVNENHVADEIDNNR